MAENSQQTNNSNKINDKRLSLAKIVKIDLNNDEEGPNKGGLKYAPAYISTSNCVENGGTGLAGIHCQLLGMLNLDINISLIQYFNSSFSKCIIIIKLIFFYHLIL